MMDELSMFSGRLDIFEVNRAGLVDMQLTG